MAHLPSHSIHDLLSRWNAGDQQALETLVPLVYNELHGLAHHYLRGWMDPRARRVQSITTSW